MSQHTAQAAHTAHAAQAERMVINEDMTIYHAEALKEKLMETLSRSAVFELDLSQVVEIDTAGLQLLLLAKRESQLQGKTFRIVAHSPAAHELIDFFNMAAYFGDPLVIPAQSTG
jgi:anti-anti-sigma factor